MKIKVGQAASGYRVGFNIYRCGGRQDIMNVWVENGKDSSISKDISVKYTTGELTIKKADYSTSRGLNDAKFAVFQAGKGWLGYDDNTKKVTFGKSWKNAKLFETGKGYCGLSNTNGEFTLQLLPINNNYYVFEIEPSSEEDYSKDARYGWSNNAGDALFTKEEWKILNDDKTARPRVLISKQKLIDLKETIEKNKDKSQKDLEAYSEISKLTKDLWTIYNAKGKEYLEKTKDEKGNDTDKYTNYVRLNKNMLKATYIVRNKNGGEGIDGKITVRKIDYDDNSLLNGFKFAIFKMNEGWLGYDAKNRKVTFGNSWENAEHFETGKTLRTIKDDDEDKKLSYCDQNRYNGEFTLSGLTYGYYYVFEIETDKNNNQYSLRGQNGYSLKRGHNLFYNNEWDMIDKDGNAVPRILCGSDLWKIDRLNVDMQDGSPYNFQLFSSDPEGSMNFIRIADYEGPYERSDKSTGYATKHATYTIKNRKDTELKIVKTDEDTGKPIENVGIKILVFLRENIKYVDDNDNSVKKYETRKWYWLNSDGSLSQDYKQATTFKTNKNGQITDKNGNIGLDRVPYGIYHIYETEAAEGYKLNEQKGYKKVKPDSYNLSDNFFDTEYVELGTSTIVPKTPVENNVVLSGMYNIQYNNNTDYVIDLYDESNSKWGVKLYKYAENSDKDGYKGQTIRISYVENGNYLICNTNSKKYVTCQSDGTPIKDAIIEDSLQGKIEGFTFSRQQWQFILKDDGSFNIKTRAGKNQTNLHVYEGTEANGTRIALQEPEESKNQKFKLESKTSIYQVPTSEDGNRKYELNAKNTPALVNLNIRKVDGTYKADTKSTEDLNLSGAELKIYGTNLKGNSQGWVKQTTEDGIVKTEYKSYSEASTFITDIDGKVDVSNLKKGTYFIFETKAPEGYDITKQEGYKIDKYETDNNVMIEIPGASEITEGQDWVCLGNATAESPKTNIVLDNIKFVSLKGKVWKDKYDEDKESKEYDYVYTEQPDELLNGINVNLYSNKDGKKELIAQASTGENGEYEFNNKTEGENKGEKLTYWELAYCYVEFMYDNKNYVVVDPFVGNDTKINSKAVEETMLKEELEDENLTGADEKSKLPGRAVTYNYNGENKLTGKEILENNASQNKDLRTTPLTGYYNNKTYTIEDINLGIMEKIIPSMQISQNLQYVKIAINNYTYTYKYGDPEVTNSQFVPTVQKQNEISYSPTKLYPSDIAYNIKNPGGLQVYLVYSIDVKNNMTDSIDDIYNEGRLYLNNLEVKYDANRFTLSKDSIGNITNNVDQNKQFEMWTGDNGVATYELGNDNDIYKDGLVSEEIKTSYIQLKAKNELINAVLEGGDKLNNLQQPTATQVFADGYHEYLRTDNVWVDDTNVKDFEGAKGTETYTDKNKYKSNDKYYIHKSLPCSDNSSSLSIKFELGKDRTISGVIFEDLDENTTDAERLGNGMFDENETKIKNVAVSLLNEAGNVTKVYPTTENHETIEKNAIVISEDGTYEIVGMVPGKYYLQFTYGNGKTVYKDLNGNDITTTIATKIDNENTPINPKLYKSTILKGNAKDEEKQTDETRDKWYQTWFLNYIGKNYSVATDLESTINSRINPLNKDKELNYEYVNSSDSNGIIDARSPKIDIKIENTDKEEGSVQDSDIPEVCSGLNFGIIERPNVNIELEKTIKNIKLTLQNGTTIINGNPKENVSPNLSSINNSNAKLELDTSYIYGSNAIVTYALSAHNRSELDYATTDYYKYGTKENGDIPVKTTVTKIVDYLNNQNASYEKQSDIVEYYTLKDEEKNIYFSKDVIDKNKNYKQTVLTPEKELSPEAFDPDNSSTDDYEFTVNNLLSSSDGILGWESHAEIIGIKNITLTPQSVSHSGNYVVGDKETFEPDTANATVAIYPSTGENKNMIICYITGGALLIIALGVVLIKKFVIKTK